MHKYNISVQVLTEHWACSTPPDLQEGSKAERSTPTQRHSPDLQRSHMQTHTMKKILPQVRNTKLGITYLEVFLLPSSEAILGGSVIRGNVA